MNASREDIERMDAFLANKLDDEGRLLFESNLVTDDDFAEEFELHKMMIAGIAAEKEARFREVLDEQRQETFIGANTWGKKFTLASAAVVLLGMVAVFYAKYKVDHPTNRSIAKTDALEESIMPTEQQPEPNKTADVSNELKKEMPAKATDELALAENEEDFRNFDIVEDASDQEDLEKMDGDEQLPVTPLPASRDDADSEEDVVVINKDKYLNKETVEVMQYFDVESNAAPRAESLSQIEIASTGKFKKAASRKAADKLTEVKDAKAPVDSAIRENRERVKVAKNEQDTTTKKKEKILIEYYSSPLNYKGYTYNVRLKKIVVYGLSETSSSLKNYQNELYLKNGTHYYRMMPTNTYIRLNRVTNALLINKLNQ